MIGEQNAQSAGTMRWIPASTTARGPQKRYFILITPTVRNRSKCSSLSAGCQITGSHKQARTELEGDREGLLPSPDKPVGQKQVFYIPNTQSKVQS